ncbi:MULTISPECIES: hypothetical protein [unclassified Apibacter]|uniref:hypothetical protein n=1 Tax=unclassified Apibacter TaxID=2630820 RepID=UPI00135E1B5D|nr:MULTISPECIES: hypothetical protein [unclassified Apibacter]MXP04782.1 hypothetical protein [Apibacter sp. B3546]MXP13131.1 hypothetical protein [Apibacter sp. B3239]
MKAMYFDHYKNFCECEEDETTSSSKRNLRIKEECFVITDKLENEFFISETPISDEYYFLHYRGVYVPLADYVIDGKILRLYKDKIPYEIEKDDELTFLYKYEIK